METSAASSRQIATFPRLQNVVLGFVLFITVSPSIGCRICTDSEDLAYPAYGGAWERTIRNHGRVGSLFDPGGAQAATLVNKDQPLSPDEIQRKEDSSEDEGDDEKNKNLDPFDVKSKDVKEQDQGEDSSENDPLQLDSDPGSDPSDELDKELQRRRKELQDMDLQDIQVLPGEPLPPIL